MPWLLLASLALNVTALFLPFLKMRRGLSTSEYSLPKSVSLMWESKLYVLAVIIVVFSVCFPFFKLGLLVSIVMGWISPQRVKHADPTAVTNAGRAVNKRPAVNEFVETFASHEW